MPVCPRDLLPANIRKMPFILHWSTHVIASRYLKVTYEQPDSTLFIRVVSSLFQVHLLSPSSGIELRFLLDIHKPHDPQWEILTIN